MSLRIAPPRRPTSRTPRRLAALTVTGALLALGAALPGAAGAQEPVPAACAGVTLDATVSAPAVPGGSWSVVDVCVLPEAVYEAELLGYHLVGGLAVATYTDGHVGRVAFLTAKVAEDRSLTLVGVEDEATGLVTWAYADGSYAASGATRTVGGAADTATVPRGAEPDPVEAGQLQVVLDGAGTDLATATGPVADQIRQFLDTAAAALSS